jgi:hypothetical protein
MFGSMLRFAAIAWLTVAAVSLTAASARAFSQESGGAPGTGSATFADPDEQLNIFGSGPGVQQFEPTGSAQIGAQPGQPTLKHFQNNGLSSPPDPLSRPGN